MIPETDKSYIAGLVDGEGCIKIQYRKINRQYLLAVTICNTNYLCLDFVKKLFKGQIQTSAPKNLRWKIRYTYQVTGRDAAILLEEIAPYLIIKRPQYEVARRFLRDCLRTLEPHLQHRIEVMGIGHEKGDEELRED